MLGVRVPPGLPIHPINRAEGLMKSAVQFLHEVKGELSKVVWPKFDELIGSTIIVLVLVTIFAIYLGVLDFGLSQVAQYIFKTYSL